MGKAESEPRHSPDVSFLPLQAGTLTMHSSTAESDGLLWLYAAQAPTLIYHKRRLIQDRTHIVTQIHVLLKSSSCLHPDSCISLSQFLFLYTLISPPPPFCMICLRGCFFCICSNNTRRWQMTWAIEGETGGV